MNQDPSTNNLPTADGAPDVDPMPQATEQATTITSTPEPISTPTPEPEPAPTPAPAPEPATAKAASNKPISTVKDITRNLIGNYLGMCVILSIVYTILYNTFLAKKIESLVVLAIVALALQAIVIFSSWKLGTSFTFRAKSIRREDVQKVMKNLLIFVIILIVVNGAYSFYEVNITLNKITESNYGLRLREEIYKKSASEEQFKKYEQEKDKAIAEAKKEIYIYLAILEVGLAAIELAMLFLVEKRLIQKHIAEENSAPASPVQPMTSATGSV